MEWSNYFKSVLKGVVWAIMVTFLITAILSLVMNSISCLALVVGSLVAVKAHGSKGWIVGLAVGCMFYIALYIIGIIFGAEPTLGMYDFIKFTLCVFIGLFSGMLGVNL